MGSRRHLHIYDCHIMSCHIMSCHIMSCHIMSYHIMSCHIMSCHIMSCHIMSYHIMSCHIMSCNTPLLICSQCPSIYIIFTFWFKISFYRTVSSLFILQWLSLRNCGRIASTCLCCYFDTDIGRSWSRQKLQHPDYHWT